LYSFSPVALLVPLSAPSPVPLPVLSKGPRLCAGHRTDRLASTLATSNNTDINCDNETTLNEQGSETLTIGDASDNFAISLPPIQAEDNNVTKPLETTKFADAFSILFGNVQGLKTQKQADKLSRLSKLCQNDHLVCLNETNLREKDATLLVKKELGKICKMKSLDNIKFVNGKRIYNNKRLKRSGFGTAMVSHRPDLINLHACSEDHEIVYAKIKTGECKGLVVTGYRSPSSKDDTDTANFYTAIDSIIKSNGGHGAFDFIVFVGDDNASSNSSCAYSRKASGYGKNIFNNHQMVDLIPGMMTRNNKQPDTCYGYFNPELIDI